MRTGSGAGSDTGSGTGSNTGSSPVSVLDSPSSPPLPLHRVPGEPPLSASPTDEVFLAFGRVYSGTARPGQVGGSREWGGGCQWRTRGEGSSTGLMYDGTAEPGQLGRSGEQGRGRRMRRRCAGYRVLAECTAATPGARTSRREPGEVLPAECISCRIKGATHASCDACDTCRRYTCCLQRTAPRDLTRPAGIGRLAGGEASEGSTPNLDPCERARKEGYCYHTIY